MNRRNLAIGIVVLVALGALFLTLGGGSLGARPTPTPEASTSDFENLVTASGTLLPARRASLAFRASGRVTRIRAAAGDVVKRGDVLAQIDSRELAAAVTIAQASLAQLVAGPTKEEVAVAKAQLDSARAQLDKVRTGPTLEEAAVAKAALDRASADLSDAQAEYDKVKDDPGVGAYPQSAALHAAAEAFESARARFAQVSKGASAEDVRVAESAVQVAQTELDRVQAPARAEEIAAAQARLDQANAALEDASLTAPFDGTVASVDIREGELSVAGTPVVMLGDTSAMRLETNDLSETDIAGVKVGQGANVTFEGFPGKTFPGKVTFLSPVSSERQGGTNYTIYVVFDQLDPTLLWGMTGHIEIDKAQ
ncbi:MAG: efflux RND transporter periplasmic adaptor subunit [Chloroflexi bacterium]|nr:efflux RND transporter periplasmic adaptor subunit [Chloroflexota bacterium]